MITSKSTLRLVTPERTPRAPRPAQRGAEIVTINIQPDDQVLLTVPRPPAAPASAAHSSTR